MSDAPTTRTYADELRDWFEAGMALPYRAADRKAFADLIALHGVEVVLQALGSLCVQQAQALADLEDRVVKIEQRMDQ